jgi:hypothetical protein
MSSFAALSTGIEAFNGSIAAALAPFRVTGATRIYLVPRAVVGGGPTRAIPSRRRS